MKTRKEFTKELKGRDAHILDIIASGSKTSLLYYREYGSYPTDVKYERVLNR